MKMQNLSFTQNISLPSLCMLRQRQFSVITGCLKYTLKSYSAGTVPKAPIDVAESATLAWRMNPLKPGAAVSVISTETTSKPVSIEIEGDIWKIVSSLQWDEDELLPYVMHITATVFDFALILLLLSLS